MIDILFHLAFPTHDVDAAKRFYLDGLGCTLGRESRQAVGVLDQDTLHFLNRLRVTLHRMWRIYDLLRFDAFNVRARILDDTVSTLGRRPAAVNANDGVGDDSIGDGDRG